MKEPTKKKLIDISRCIAEARSGSRQASRAQSNITRDLKQAADILFNILAEEGFEGDGIDEAIEMDMDKLKARLKTADDLLKRLTNIKGDCAGKTDNGRVIWRIEEVGHPEVDFIDTVIEARDYLKGEG